MSFTFSENRFFNFQKSFGYTTVFAVTDAKDYFRRAVIARDHVRSHHRRLTRVTRQPKVEDFQFAPAVHNDVTRLKILQNSKNKLSN